MNYSGLYICDVANGLGWRVSLFVSGCSLHCPGCFNSEAWDFSFGKQFGISAQNKILELLKPDYIKGLSLLGGNPTEPQNEPDLIAFIERMRSYYGETKDVWMWSGHTFEELVERDDKLLPLCDVLVDGPFVESKKDLTLAFRGSSNQRIIDVKKSLAEKTVVLLDM